MALGPEVSAPLETAYRSKLHSLMHTQPEIASQQQRQIPRFLRIIATPHDNQKHCLTVESTGSDVLGWASSPKPVKPSPFKPKPGPTWTRAWSGLRPGLRFQKPEPQAQAYSYILF